MIRDALFCLTRPFQCIADALPPWAWWVIGISIALIVIGLAIRVWNIAHAVGGKPAAIGALGLLGTVAVAILTALSGRGGRSPEPTDIDGPDAEPSVARNRRTKLPTKPNFVRKPLFPWLRKRLGGD